jgi:hypothetical protein
MKSRMMYVVCVVLLGMAVCPGCYTIRNIRSRKLSVVFCDDFPLPTARPHKATYKKMLPKFLKLATCMNSCSNSSDMDTSRSKSTIMSVVWVWVYTYVYFLQVLGQKQSTPSSLTGHRRLSRRIHPGPVRVSLLVRRACGAGDQGVLMFWGVCECVVCEHELCLQICNLNAL